MFGKQKKIDRAVGMKVWQSALEARHPLVVSGTTMLMPDMGTIHELGREFRVRWDSRLPIDEEAVLSAYLERIR